MPNNLIEDDHMVELQFLKDNYHGGSWKEMLSWLRNQLTRPANHFHVKNRNNITRDIALIEGLLG